jgi:hypothetical protein
MGRFRRLLEAYGADPAHWPQDLRPAAERLLHANAKARALQAQARALDMTLRSDEIAGEQMDGALLARILERAMAQPQERRLTEPLSAPPFRLNLRWLLPQAAGLAAAGIVGFAVGFSGVLPDAGFGGRTIDLSDFAVGVDLEEGTP